MDSKGGDVMSDRANSVLADIQERYDASVERNLLLMQNKFTEQELLDSLELVRRTFSDKQVDVFRLNPIGYGIIIESNHAE
jgi:hypothetical protein